MSQRDRRARAQRRRRARVAGTARDPHASRGALRPARVLAALRAREGAALTPAALARALGCEVGAVHGLHRTLRALEAKGLIERIEGRFRVPRRDGGVEGRLVRVEASASWHVVADDGARWRIEHPGDARAGDRVRIQPLDETGCAELLHVVEGAREHWIGILHRRGGLIHATPYRDDGEWLLRVARDDAGDARDGDVVELVPAARRPRRREAEHAQPWARVTRRLGRPGESAAAFAAVVWRHRLPVDFPDDVLGEVADLAEAEGPDEVGERLDLRALPFVTVDPDDARDFDDAVCAEPAPDGGLLLRVAVADVAHYVAPGSALDREALRRGNSVYFPDRAIPMLPPRLSADLCSLRPGRDRLALVVELACDAQARTRGVRFHSARIRSHARLTYREAQAQLEGARGDHAAMLGELARWAQLRVRERRARGGLDFELPGVEIGFDEAGWPRDVRREVRGAAHRLVEEAMLAANRAVAESLRAEAVPIPYRNHEAPTAEDAALLAEHLRAFGIARAWPEGPLTARALSRALARTPAAQVGVVHALVLRQLRQARYGAASLGHFGLALPHYLHFTSPIRRYADLVVHRAVKDRLAGRLPANPFAAVQRVAARASVRERIAVRAEREMLDLARCAFLHGRVGEEHTGTISGIGRVGLFVTLAPWPVDGLVGLPRLGPCEPDALGHSLVTGSGQRFRLGERVRVRVAAVDLVRARVDLDLVEPAPRAPARAARRSSAQARGGRGGRGRRKGSAGRTRSRAPAAL